MDHLISSINRSIKDKNWYGALAISLSIPDICSKINDGTKTTGKKYASWFNEYVGIHYQSNYPEPLLQKVLEYSTKEDYLNLKKPRLTGNDCYALRCAYLHEGIGEISTQRAREVLDEILFVEPSNEMELHGSIVNNKLILRIDEFCSHILAGAEAWKRQLNLEQKARLNSFLLVKDVFEVARNC